MGCVFIVPRFCLFVFWVRLKVRVNVFCLFVGSCCLCFVVELGK